MGPRHRTVQSDDHTGKLIQHRNKIYVVFRRFGRKLDVVPSERARGYFGRIPWVDEEGRKTARTIWKAWKCTAMTPPPSPPNSPPPSSPPETEGEEEEEWVDNNHANHNELHYNCKWCLIRSSIQALWRRGELENNPRLPSLLTLARQRARECLGQIDRRQVNNYIRSLSLSEEMIRALVFDQMGVC